MPSESPHQTESPRKVDIGIIGGGIVGSRGAYFLLKAAPTLNVGVIEPDSSYEFASTLRTSGGCRVQFTCPKNIQMSLFGLEFNKTFEATMATTIDAAPLEAAGQAIAELIVHRKFHTIDLTVYALTRADKPRAATATRPAA